MQNIQNIIFDYGNVIFEIDFSRAQQAFTELGVPRVSELYGHREQNPIFDDFDRGTITAAEFREAVRKLSNRPNLSDAQIDQAWNALLIGVPDGNHELLLDVKNRYQTFLLSNNNEIHYQWILDYLQREHQLEDNSVFFQTAYYSHLMGMRKPDREIFDFVLQKENLKPEETLFIDDSPQHIATAKSLGIQTRLVKGAGELIHLGL